jgi:peptidyl-dipeptidase Dcp
MKNFPVIFAALTMLLLSNCKKETMSENPFLTAYQTLFEVPPFDKIDTTHYMPAFLERNEAGE